MDPTAGLLSLSLHLGKKQKPPWMHWAGGDSSRTMAWMGLGAPHISRCVVGMFCLLLFVVCWLCGNSTARICTGATWCWSGRKTKKTWPRSVPRQARACGMSSFNSNGMANVYCILVRCRKCAPNPTLLAHLCSATSILQEFHYPTRETYTHIQHSTAMIVCGLGVRTLRVLAAVGCTPWMRCTWAPPAACPSTPDPSGKCRVILLP